MTSVSDIDISFTLLYFALHFIYLEAIRRKIELDVHTGDEVYLEHIRRYVGQLYSNSV